MEGNLTKPGQSTQNQFDISDLKTNFSYMFGENYEFQEDILPYFKFRISNLFIFVLFFTIDGHISFISVHGFNESDHDESRFKIFQNLSNYLSGALKYFLNEYGNEGLYSFMKWIIGYDKMFYSKCKKCGEVIINDNGILLPPFKKSLNENEFYHTKCFPDEERVW